MGKSKTHIHMMQEGNETSEGQQSEIACTDTMTSENGRAEGRTGLYLAGADSSFLITPDMNTYSMEISGLHTYTHTEPKSDWGRLLRPAAASALHFLVHVLMELKLLIGILHGPVLQLPEEKEEDIEVKELHTR